ncbi:conserved exported hypothetical protein [Candidatus Desulfosporosinus infrequens]|uniref:Uncharacterized protein n=1 Tax=Candidatus Desulfosporosinus infrequens TaxID=2043169 RepID=A0A2U3LPK7_9FIRM|nr:conserved exported hypothetical protein [Candidatus Desulfosporosinus infrequens]
MNLYIILGFMTIVAGMTLIATGTDGGRELSVNMSVMIGSIMVMLGTVRLRKGFWLRKQEVSQKRK